MKTNKLLKTILIATMLTGVTACSSNSSASTATSETSEVTSLTVQFVPTNNDGSMDAKVKPFEEYLSKALDCDVTVTMATDYSTIVEAMASGKIDIGIMPPAAYVQAREQGAAKAILSSSLTDYDENEQPIADSSASTFKGEVLVKADSNLKSLSDLKGKTIATLSANSASGYIYPVAEMKDLGIDPTTDCTIVTVNDIPSEITAVLNGQADAAFVFEGARYVFSSKFENNDLYEDLKVLYLTEGDIPNDAIAVLPTMSSDLQAKVKEVFLNMPNDEEGKEAMSLWGHTAYTEADESAYDTIESYIAKAAE
jgi:phosphonate transport system substrate-binding protein